MSDAVPETNFHGYSHGQLRGMVEAMDSGSVMAASDPWRRAADSLKQIRTALNTASADATATWEGTSSDAFYKSMTSLANSVNSAASYANDAAVAMQMTAEAIDTAKRDMPEEPSFLDQAADTVSDFAKSAVGEDDEDTRTGIADEKKAQAVAVMQTLSLKYRVTTQFLKPPPTGFIDDDNGHDLAPSDSGGASALASLIMGGGMGFVGAQSAGSTTATASRTSGQSVAQRSVASPKATGTARTDSGIQGGIANPSANPKAPQGPGTGLDGVTGGGRVGGGTGTTGLGGTNVIGGEGPGRGGFGLTGTGEYDGLPLSGSGGGGGGAGSGRGGPGTGVGRGGGAFGSSGMGEGGAGLGKAGSAGGRSAGPARRGGVVGEAGEGGSRRGAFTEGGSGLGRGRAGSGQAGAGQGHGMPGGAQAGKKEKKKGKDRPDYLVEDEETWMSGDHVNPNVVE